MKLPSISVLQARSTYAIGLAVSLLVLSGYLPASESQATEALFMGYASDFWEGALEIGAALSGFWAWYERSNPSKSLSLRGD